MTRIISWIFMLTLSTLVACGEAADAGPALGTQSAAVIEHPCQNQDPCVIDDFTTGVAQLSLVSDTVSRNQTGSMLGGVREIYFTVDGTALQQPSSYTVNGSGGLVISSGLKSYWGMYLIYDQGGNVSPLGLDLTPYDKACLNFGSNDQPVSGGVQLYHEGTHATASWYADASPRPFSVEIPYTAFDSTTGSTPPWSDVEQVVVLLQTGSANAGNDLQLESVTLGACSHPPLPAP
jgi:hypothetical protein